MATTLQRLLWGPGCDDDLENWDIRAWETPEVGLPVLIACFLFRGARHADEQETWHVEGGPLTWRLDGGVEVLASGRRSQFGVGGVQPLSHEPLRIDELRLSRTAEWEVRPHEAYMLPFVNERPDNVDRGAYILYCDTLLLLTALDGGERILSRLSERGVGSVPFEDRWAWRSRIHLPRDAWRQIEHILRWTERPGEGRAEVGQALARALEPISPDVVTVDDFLLERVDIVLERTNDIEVVRTVQRTNSQNEGGSPPLALEGATGESNFIVRIGQVEKWAPAERVADDFPVVDGIHSDEIMEQVANVFQSPSYTGSGQSPSLVLFPEVTVPQTEVSTVRDLVARTGRASLGGLYWRVLPPVYPCRHITNVQRWFVNEAELVLPMGYNDPGPTSLRWFRVRKPVPAHLETGLARRLSEERPGSWDVLKGQRWYRFVHSEWGDFTIAICADLLDAEPWRSLRGELLHLFMVAFNRDVDLYESLTWVRAYENYVNVVTVNHGTFGGSFLWTPRRRRERELARLRGERLFLVADVDVPVRSLLDAQRNGVDHAVARAVREWAGQGEHGSDFRAPPPGFERRGP